MLRTVTLILATTVFPAGSAAQVSDQPGAAEWPNILLITVDTLRADHLSSYGYHLKTSPRIDQLASEGVRFERAYSPIPLTGPSHISLFTSRYPQEHGARINGLAVPKDSRWMFLPQILRRFDYKNGAFVSSYTLTSRLTRLDRWFDVYDQDLTRSYQVFNSSRYAEDVTPRAIEWLDQNQQGPFFLWVHYFDPHSPYHLREEFADPEPSGHPEPAVPPADNEIAERIRKYDSEIGYADRHIGMLLDRLDELGLRETTIVALTSDHGESLGEHGYVGHGRHLYEGIIRIPMILRYPPKIAAGQVVSEGVSLLDLAPTLLDLTVRGEIESDLPLSFVGRSLAPNIVADEPLPERPIRYVTYPGKKGFAPGWLSWVWVRKDEVPLKMGESEGARKLIWRPREDVLWVLNTEDDPGEVRPRVVEKSDSAYNRETAVLKRWFDATNLAPSGDNRMTARDSEVLRSLGYIQ